MGCSRDKPADLVSAPEGGGEATDEGRLLTCQELYTMGLSAGQVAYVRTMTTRARQEAYLTNKRDRDARWQGEAAGREERVQ